MTQYQHYISTMIREIIVGADNEVLRRASKVVMSAEAVERLVFDMHETLAATENGIGLAASQVGENVCLFVIHPDFAEEADGHLVYLNPQITKISRGLIEQEEGCLSLPETWGTVSRSAKVTVKAQDENGEKFKVRAKGLLARLFQHEVDHLSGTLFIDHLK